MHLIHPLHPLLTLLTLLTPSATSTLLRLTSHCDRPYYYVFTTPNISAEAPPNTFTSTPVTKINSTLPSFEHVLEGQGQQLGISDTENYWTGKQWILGLNTEVESLGAEERVGRRVWWNVNCRCLILFSLRTDFAPFFFDVFCISFLLADDLLFSCSQQRLPLRRPGSRLERYDHRFGDFGAVWKCY